MLDCQMAMEYSDSGWLSGLKKLVYKVQYNSKLRSLLYKSDIAPFTLTLVSFLYVLRSSKVVKIVVEDLRVNSWILRITQSFL